MNTEETIFRDADREISKVVRRELAARSFAFSRDDCERQCRAASEALALLRALPEDLPEIFSLEARRWLAGYLCMPEANIPGLTVKFLDIEDANRTLEELVNLLDGFEKGDSFYARRIVQGWLGAVLGANVARQQMDFNAAKGKVK